MAKDNDCEGDLNFLDGLHGAALTFSVVTMEDVDFGEPLVVGEEHKLELCNDPLEFIKRLRELADWLETNQVEAIVVELG